MLFQTTEFLILIAAVIAGLLALKRARYQHLMLLAASYVFYGWWDVRFLMLILLSSVIDYAAGLGMGGIKMSWGKRLKLSGVIVAGTAIFLGLNWPMVQGEHGEGFGLKSFVQPEWAGHWWAVGICLVVALVGPVLYGLYFREGEHARRKAFLVTSVVANLGMLGFFKYFNFFTDNLIGLGHELGLDAAGVLGATAGDDGAWRVLSVALPVGISFYTFQTMSYTIDAYRRQVEPERSFIRMALYVAYFPQLVAGPILRPQQFLPSLDRAWVLTGANVRSGYHLILLGFFKKVLIADNVAPLVDVILNEPGGQTSLAVWLATVLFAVQIYCDFSGYTDIARGVSRMFGVEIPLNFNFPYFSTSIIDFWRRWHISLSTWLRDYLYIPLGGNRLGTGRTYFNLMATMVLGGLWHGASWNFVIWGTYQGVLLCVNRVVRSVFPETSGVGRFLLTKPGTVLRWAVTAYLWLLGWLIFRVQNLDELLHCMRKFVLFDGNLNPAALGLGRGSPATAMLALGAFVVLHTVGFFSTRWADRLDAMPAWLRVLLYLLLGMLFFYGWPPESAAFIYFQF